jgi:FtsZ-binding cell division protein ZapB
MSIRKLGTREEFLESEVRTLNHHIQSMIDTMKVMSMNKQDMSDEIERLKSEVETAVNAEREACARLCEEMASWHGDLVTAAYDSAADAIRKRGQE